MKLPDYLPGLKNFFLFNFSKTELLFLLVFCTPLLLSSKLYAGINSDGNPSSTGTLVGDILDMETREALGWTTLYIPDLNRSVSAHEDGSFHFYDLPAGTYEMHVFRVGYHEQQLTIEIIADKTSEIRILMDADALYGQTIVVEADRDDSASEISKPQVEVSGKKLRQNLGRTVAETIDYEPGISQRTMGPAPARPVLRGLGGDRLLILEDGQRTGDLSGTSADHAVAVEPITAERVEVIRGPQAIVYGANALGGIVNIGRDYILSNLPHRVTGSASLQGESVNSGYAPAFSIAYPLGDFALKADGSLRKANDISTPAGQLNNTEIETYNGSAGLGFYRSWGYIGGAAAYYKSDYGIPGLPDTLGGHPGGVDINLERRNQQINGVVFPSIDWLRQIQVKYSRTNYSHEEYEKTGSVGMRFRVITHNIDTRFQLTDGGQLTNGQIGFWGEYRNYSSGGLSFTPNTTEYAAAAFYYQEYERENFAANFSLRWDYKTVDPDVRGYSEILDGDITRRAFNDFSGGISFHYHITPVLIMGIGIVRTFRAPGVEELFSEGPHLAAYAYEVGNATLGKENGLSTEFSVKYEEALFSAQVAVYRNAIAGYIFPKNTGERSWQRNDLYVYRYVGEDALMYGFEAAYEWHFYHHFKTGGTISYVYGNLTDRDEPIPRIPPLEAKLKLYHDYDQIILGGDVRLAARQDRLGEFETPTAGYLVFDLFGQHNFSWGGLFHTISVTIENITDIEYYKHLNRVKVIMPEPGRNFKLLYKIYF